MEDTWIDINETPLPKAGQVIVSVTARDPGLRSFVSVVRCDETGPYNSFGDTYMYHKEITHWQPLPNPRLTSDYN